MVWYRVRSVLQNAISASCCHVIVVVVDVKGGGGGLRVDGRGGWMGVRVGA